MTSSQRYVTVSRNEPLHMNSSEWVEVPVSDMLHLDNVMAYVSDTNNQIGHSDSV